MPKKKKTKTYSALKKELDRVFSIWVRKRDADENGVISCCCCATKMPWPKSQAAHYIPRHKLPTRWEPTNVHACCWQCNVAKKGNYPAYALFLLGAYGSGHLETLVWQSEQTAKLTRADLQALIVRYSDPLPEARISAPGAS